MNVVVGAFVCVVLCTPAAAQVSPPPRIGQASSEYRLVNWTTVEGLPQSTINDILVLPSGEIYLATFGGLVQFDGSQFRVVDIAADPGLPSNRITALALTPAGTVAFVTQQGHLGMLEDGRARTLAAPPSPLRDVVGLVATREGEFFTQADDGSVWQTNGTQPWRRVLVSPERSVPAINALTTTASGEVWAAHGHEVARVRRGAEALGPSPLVALPEGCVTVAARADGGLWLGLERGVGRVVSGRFERLDIRPPLDTRAAVVEPESETVVWVGSATMLARLQRQADGTWTRSDHALGLPRDAAIRSLSVDSTGSLWIGTNGTGLYLAHRWPTRRFGAEAGLVAIIASVTDGDGGAWASSGCAGVFHLDEAGAATHVELSRLAQRSGHGGGSGYDGCDHSLAFAPGRGVWVRARQHLYLAQRDPLRVWRAPITLPDEAGPVVVSADGSLWIASRGGLVQRVSPDGSVVASHQLAPPLHSASLGVDGSLWLGGDAAVYRIVNGTVARLGESDGVPRGAVRDLLPAPEGYLWIGTYGGGLGYLRDGRIRRVTADQGLPDNAVSRLIDDGRGRVWISTNRGVVVVDRQELTDVALGARRTLDPVVLGPERGIPEANFGSPAGFADQRGRLWFGTINGLVRIDGPRFPFNREPPVAHVERVAADGGPLPPGPTVQIPAGTERVRIDFTAYAPVYPERMRFRFRLEGVDRDWVDVGSRRVATWTPAGPGRHRFLVEARNEDGVWSAAPAVVQLELLPQWWQTTLVRVLALMTAGLVVGVATIGAFRWRLRAMERRHRERLRILEEQRLAEERAASLRSQLEHVSRVALAGELAASLAHEVNQPLAAIVSNAEAGRRYLEKFPDQTDEVAAIFTDIASAGMRASEVIRGLRGFLKAGAPATDDIDLSALAREMLPLVRRELQEEHVQVELSLDRALPPVKGVRVQLGQVVVNLVMNACEALATVDSPRRITITTRARDGHVELEVRDTGPGFSPEVADRPFDPFVTTKPDGMGMGLAICRSIAEAHEGRLTATTPPGGGVAMVLALPHG